MGLKIDFKVETLEFWFQTPKGYRRFFHRLNLFLLFQKDWISFFKNGPLLLESSQSVYFPAGGIHSQRETTSLLEIDRILLKI